MRLNNNNKIASILWLLVHINLRLSSTKISLFFQAECPHCKGKYSNLSQHIHKVHLKTKNVMCEKCGMTFYHNSNLKKHIETTHTQSKAIQSLNNNYLGPEARRATSPTTGPPMTTTPPTITPTTPGTTRTTITTRPDNGGSRGGPDEVEVSLRQWW